MCVPPSTMPPLLFFCIVFVCSTTHLEAVCSKLWVQYPWVRSRFLRYICRVRWRQWKLCACHFFSTATIYIVRPFLKQFVTATIYVVRNLSKAMLPIWFSIRGHMVYFLSIRNYTYNSQSFVFFLFWRQLSLRAFLPYILCDIERCARRFTTQFRLNSSPISE